MSSEPQTDPPGDGSSLAAGRATDVVETAARAMAAGEPIVIHDDCLCLVAVAAEAVDADVINYLTNSCRGVICVAMTPERLDALEIPLMERSPSSTTPALAVSVDAIVGTTTGISAADRAATVRALLGAAPDGTLTAPGHVLPVRAAAGGILERRGIAESAIEIARIAGCQPVVATCEILGDDGSLLRPEELADDADFSSLIAVSPALVHSHRRGLSVVPMVDAEGFREAMSLLSATVCAVTTRDADGEPRGMLATAVTSYTDSPPSLLISVAHSSRTHDPLVGAVGVGVHLLAYGQDEVARVLASKSEDKFVGLDWSWDGDVPRIGGALAYMRCLRAQTFQHHDHTIVIADVETSEFGNALPLLYFRRTLGWRLAHPSG